MKKILKCAAIVVCIIVCVILILVGSFTYVTEYKVTDVGTDTSEDGSYNITFQMIGEPEWPFGSTDVQIIVKKSDGTVIKKVRKSIQDDGASFREANWEVSWHDDYVDIKLKGSEQSDEIVTVDLN